MLPTIYVISHGYLYIYMDIYIVSIFNVKVTKIDDIKQKGDFVRKCFPTSVGHAMPQSS